MVREQNHKDFTKDSIFVGYYRSLESIYMACSRIFRNIIEVSNVCMCVVYVCMMCVCVYDNLNHLEIFIYVVSCTPTSNRRWHRRLRYRSRPRAPMSTQLYMLEKY
jgi:hypothetical protein